MNAPDSRRLLTAGGDQAIQVWDVATQAVSATFRGNESEVWALVLLPDGHTLISGGRDGSVRQWDLNAPPTQGFPRKLPVIFPDFTADGSRFVALDAKQEDHESISLWDARTAQKLETLTEFGTDNYIFDLSPDGRWFATAGRFETFIEVWDWATRRRVTQFDLPARSFALGFSAGGSFLGVRYYLQRPASTAGQAREGRAWRTGSWNGCHFLRMGL